MKIVFCTYDIDGMPLNIRKRMIDGKEVTIDKIHHSYMQLHMAARYAKEGDVLFTYCKEMATHVMLPDGTIEPINEVDIPTKIAEIEKFMNEELKYTNDPFLGWIREDYMAMQTSYLVNEVDYDKLAEKIRKNREERANVVRTELDLIEKLRGSEELRKVIVFDNDEPIELKTVNERDTFFKSLMLIVLNGTEHEFETPFDQSGNLKYEIHFESKIVYRENCVFATEDIEEENQASLDDVKE